MQEAIGRDDLPSYFGTIRQMLVPMYTVATGQLVEYHDSTRTVKVHQRDTTRQIRLDNSLVHSTTDIDPMVGLFEDQVFLWRGDSVLQSIDLRDSTSVRVNLAEKLQQLGYGTMQRTGTEEGIDYFVREGRLFLFYYSDQGLYIFRTDPSLAPALVLPGV